MLLSSLLVFVPISKINLTYVNWCFLYKKKKKKIIWFPIFVFLPDFKRYSHVSVHNRRIQYQREITLHKRIKRSLFCWLCYRRISYKWRICYESTLGRRGACFNGNFSMQSIFSFCLTDSWEWKQLQVVSTFYGFLYYTEFTSGESTSSISWTHYTNHATETRLEG